MILLFFARVQSNKTLNMMMSICRSVCLSICLWNVYIKHNWRPTESKIKFMLCTLIYSLETCQTYILWTSPWQGQICFQFQETSSDMNFKHYAVPWLSWWDLYNCAFFLLTMTFNLYCCKVRYSFSLVNWPYYLSWFLVLKLLANNKGL